MIAAEPDQTLTDAQSERRAIIASLPRDRLIEHIVEQLRRFENVRQAYRHDL
jgi:hypothetical protein